MSVAFTHKIFSAHLKLYRTIVEKSTFRTQNDTDKANFWCRAEKKYFPSHLKLENLV